MSSIPDLAAQIETTLGPIKTGHKIAFGELTLTTTRDQIIGVLTKLRDDPALQFEQLIDLCGVDYPARAERSAEPLGCPAPAGRGGRRDGDPR